jgi:environmental stress-induced protein Ves
MVFVMRLFAPPSVADDGVGMDQHVELYSGEGFGLTSMRQRAGAIGGEWQIESELEDGPVTVVNLMADRRRAAIDLRFAAAITQLAITPGTLVLYAAAGASTVELSDVFIELAPADAVQVESDGPIVVTLRSGVIAAASIRPLSSR